MKQEYAGDGVFYIEGDDDIELIISGWSIDGVTIWMYHDSPESWKNNEQVWDCPKNWEGV